MVIFLKMEPTAMGLILVPFFKATPLTKDRYLVREAE